MRSTKTRSWHRFVVSLFATGLVCYGQTASSTVIGNLLDSRIGIQQASGSISGTVIDANTGKYLEGADISIDGTSLKTTSARSGEYALRNVPLGAQKITVSYPGMDPVSLSVEIMGGGLTKTPVRLGQASEVVTLTAFTVSGAKEGMAQAVATQRAAINYKFVAASDQFGDIAQGNAAEYLKFLPGVNVAYNANDARAITLRGMPSLFTNVTQNGNPLASPNTTNAGASSRYEFELFSINHIETTEVNKTLTSDLPATSTAGSVNMIPKSAFDRAGNEFSYRAYLAAQNSALGFSKTEGWGQEKTRKIFPGVDLNYSRHLGENLGIYLGYKNSSAYSDYPRSRYTWLYSPASGALPAAPWVSNWQLQNEQKIIRREALAGQVDYKLGEHTKLSVNGQWSFHDNTATDRVLTIRPGNPSATGLSSADSVSYGTGGTYAGRAGQGSVSFDTFNANKTGNLVNFGANLTHDFLGDSKINAGTYWSQGYIKYRDTTGGYYGGATIQRTGLNVTMTRVGEVAPSWNITDSAGAPVDLRDTSKFTLSGLNNIPKTIYDTRNGGSLDLKTPLKTAMPITVMVGARIDYHTRNIDNHSPSLGGTIATGSQVTSLADQGFSDHPLGYGVPAFNVVDLYRAFSQFGGNRILNPNPGSDLQVHFADQNKAGYARLDVTPIPDLLIVGGLRYETHTTDSENRLSTTPVTVIRSTNGASGYYPAASLKYTPSRQLSFRLGASKSISNPDFADLIPGAPVIVDNASARGAISVYNPTLKTYNSANYDAGVEYYFSKSAFVSASVFRKNLTGYIASVTQAGDAATLANLGIDPNALRKAPDQYDVTYKLNIPDAAHFDGVELAYAQNFSFLPKPFNTLGLQVNVTLVSIGNIKPGTIYSNSVTDPNLNGALLEAVNASLKANNVTRSMNVELNYSIGKFSITGTCNYADRYQGGATRNTVKFANEAVNRYYFENVHFAPRAFVDVRMDYKWNRKFTPYLQIRNVFNRPFVLSTQTVVNTHFETGDPGFELGVRGNF